MRNTCAECPQLIVRKTHFCVVPFCEITNTIIPHHGSDKGDKWEITYWRIPVSCPLPDGQVCKSEDRAPEKDWVVDLVSVHDSA